MMSRQRRNRAIKVCRERIPSAQEAVLRAGPVEAASVVVIVVPVQLRRSQGCRLAQRRKIGAVGRMREGKRMRAREVGRGRRGDVEDVVHMRRF